MHGAIRRALNLPDGLPITQADMRKLTRLDAPESRITNLAGLEYATNLIFLGLGDNSISDLTPLGELARLEILYLLGNPLSDLSSLKNLTALQHLALQDCQISDISPLASLTQLSQLILSGNKIVDVRPLASLTMLRELEIDRNLIMDHSPLDRLSLTYFKYDQSCELPPLPLQPRLENRSFPSVFAAWGGIGWSSVLNQPHLSDIEQMSQHDLYFCCLIFAQHFSDTGSGWHVRGDLERAVQIRNDYIALNPNMIFLSGIEFSGSLLEVYPEDWPYWLRDAQGEIVKVPGEGPPAGLFDFTHPGFQDRMVDQAVAVSKCGLYDGIMIDWWNDLKPRLAIGNTVYRGLEVEIQAKINILERIRAQTRPDFLIIVNVNRAKLPRTGQYINGSFMETGTPFHDSNIGGSEEIERGLQEIESTLLWAERNMREPRINSLEGWGFPNEPMDSPTNRRWMRVFTTLSLTHSDGYTLFIDPTRRAHGHYWYDFWDVDLGHPVGAKAQLYEEIPGLYIREFTNGWVVYNHSDEPRVITLPAEVQGVASGLVNTEHALPNLDGEMYLRVKPKNPADVNSDGVVNIFDLTIIAQAFGTHSLEGDVNGDGVVNVFDLVFVANQF